MAQKVFVSYSHQDKDSVNTFLSLISKKSFDVWMDNQSLKSGDYYISTLFKEIAASDIYLVFLSKASQESNWLTEELEYALKETINNKHLKIAGIILDKSPIPDALSHRHLIDGKESIFTAANTFTKDFQGEAISNEDKTQITSVSFGICEKTDVQIGPFVEGLSSDDMEEEAEQLLEDLRKQIQGILLNLIDVKDFDLHSPVPQFRNGTFSERKRKVSGSTAGSICEMVTVEATVFHPVEARIQKYLDERMDAFECSYISFGFSNPAMIGENKKLFEVNSLAKLQNAYTIVEYDIKDGVKVNYGNDIFISVSYPEDGVRVKIETEYKFQFKDRMKKINIFQFVDWLMTE